MKTTKQIAFNTFLKLSYCPILGIRYLGLAVNNRTSCIIKSIDHQNKKFQNMQIVKNRFSRQKR